MPLTSINSPASFDGGELRFTMMDGARTVDCFLHPFAINEISHGIHMSNANRLAAFHEHRRDVEAIASDLFDSGERRPYVTAAVVQDYLEIGRSSTRRREILTIAQGGP